MPKNLSDHPRTKLVHGATPLHELPRISNQLGIDLWIKRDDLAGAPFGGNKSRQLEYYLGHAAAEGADTILITGAVQSNFVRTAAAAAASLGMQTVVQLEDRVPGMGERYQSSGNVMLLKVLGAEIMHYPLGEDEAGADAALRARAEELRGQGRKPYVIPLGLGNPPRGALGYMQCGIELAGQAEAFDIAMVASGSGLTHAGLLAGLRAAGAETRVIGSCVRRDAALQTGRIGSVLADLQALVVEAGAAKAGDIEIWDGALAPGYGRLGPAAEEAMKLLARQEGIFLDPVYTAKVFAAIPALVETGEITKGARVVFLHTGGLAALFAYEDEMKAVL